MSIINYHNTNLFFNSSILLSLQKYPLLNLSLHIFLLFVNSRYLIIVFLHLYFLNKIKMFYKSF
jgi:hypothetical protein